MPRKMGSVYPVLDKEEPPEDKPETGGQEEEPGHEKGQEEREQHQEEKYLEEACQEVQREINVAKTRDLLEACQDYRREIQAARRKLEIHTAGKPGIIRLPEIPSCPLQGCHPTLPHPSNQDSDSDMGKHENITDDEKDNGPCQTNSYQFVQFKQQGSYVPERPEKCVTRIAEGIKNLRVQNNLKPQRIQYAKNKETYEKRKQDYQDYQDYYQDYQDTQKGDRKQTHSVYLAGGKNRHLHDCLMLSHLPRTELGKDQDKVEDTETTSEEEPDWRTDGMTGWLRGAEDLGVNTKRYCHECGNNSSKIEFSPDGDNLREFLCLIRQAEIVVELERMTRKRDEATSKRQQKKLDKKIRRKRARCSASHTLNQILREERARTKKERIRKKGKGKHQKEKVPNPNTTLDSDREDQLDWAHAYAKYAEQWEEPESQDKDRQEDRKFKEVSGKLIETFLRWRLSEIEEMKSAEEIVTISSSESSDESDWDWEEYRVYNEFNDGYKCKCRRGHKTKKATVACIAQKDYEPEVEIWEEAVNELGKAIKREEVSTKSLANDIRVEALVMGIRRDNPAEPTFTGAALRPKSQECHQGDLYQEAKRQARQEGPPKYTYVYNSTTDIWLKYLTNPKDVLTHILGKISQTAERKAIRSKIESMVTLSKCFQEITHREEVARKGFGVGKNLRQYDGGRKIEKKAKKIMIKWENERARYAQIQRNLTRIAAEPARRPGPTTKCDGCQRVPDSRLRQCGRCKHAFYCTIECQRRTWHRHREECEYWVMQGPARRKAM